jgi:hypothetical protein
MRRRKRSRYIRMGIYEIDEVLPYVFTREVRMSLIAAGFNYHSQEWKEASRRSFRVVDDCVEKDIVVPMGSHRYQLYAKKGVVCVSCGLKGKFFALERGHKDNPIRPHFNLYAIDPKTGKEVMITKDHIKPRSKGGKNRLENYQPMCFRCNQRKGDKIENGKS